MVGDPLGPYLDHIFGSASAVQHGIRDELAGHEDHVIETLADPCDAFALRCSHY